MEGLQLYGLVLTLEEIVVLTTAVSSYIAKEQVQDNAMLLLITELMNNKAKKLENFDNICESLANKIEDLTEMI